MRHGTLQPAPERLDSAHPRPDAGGQPDLAEPAPRLHDDAAGPAKAGTPLTLRPRCYRTRPANGGASAQANFGYTRAQWTAPAQQFALVLVDIWNPQCQFRADARDRAELAIRRAIVPALEAWRSRGLLVVHAPGPPIAQRHANWVGDQPGGADGSGACGSSAAAWPPPALFRGDGPYAGYRRPDDPEAEAHRAYLREHVRTFHPLAEPRTGEPVVATGLGLHAWCAQRGVVSLVYAGFNANVCMMTRDYGIIDMIRRGYHVALLRDGTAAMETHETAAQGVCLRGAITSIEQFGGGTLSCEELISAVRH